MATTPRAAILAAYADRLHRHRERIADDIAAARVRIAWRAHELDARAALTASQVAALEAIGVLGERDGQGEDVELIARRTAQAEALEALLRFTDQRVQAMEETEPEEAA